MRRLIAEADILVENFRPGVLETRPGWETQPDNLWAGDGARLSLRPDRAVQDQPGFGAVGESMGGLRYITGFRIARRCAPAFPSAIDCCPVGCDRALMALRHKEVNGGRAGGRCCACTRRSSQ